MHTTVCSNINRVKKLDYDSIESLCGALQLVLPRSDYQFWCFSTGSFQSFLPCSSVLPCLVAACFLVSAFALSPMRFRGVHNHFSDSFGNFPVVFLTSAISQRFSYCFSNFHGVCHQYFSHFPNIFDGFDCFLDFRDFPIIFQTLEVFFLLCFIFRYWKSCFFSSIHTFLIGVHSKSFPQFLAPRFQVCESFFAFFQSVSDFLILQPTVRVLTAGCTSSSTFKQLCEYLS
ncbi:hypothetical protein O6H91_05G039100 [Diphasiastrum complanatum]|uniref:Uncharacterized protein n=1 Tax=Diphasiastrum complanatum TaxID=34168 RepID=A0ACC2DMF1_DIPCM|nr:hypothetical protein O6H91_05G039100 [Diphasiastrum complanatum]